MRVKKVRLYTDSFISVFKEAISGNHAHVFEDNATLLRRSRYVRVVRTAITGASNTILTMLVGLLSVPLTVRYLGTERYGIWLTISTILTWLSIADLGVGNGLVNYLSQSNGKDENGKAQEYVSSAFWLLMFIGLIIITFGLVTINFDIWKTIFYSISSDSDRELPIAILSAFVIFGFSFPLSVSSKVFIGYQEGYYCNYFNIAGSIISLFSLILVTYFRGGLALLVIAMFGSKQFVMLISTIFLFAIHKPELLPSLNRVSLKYMRSLMSVGGMFLAVQLAALLIQQTDILVIAKFLGPASVAIYGTALRLFTYIGIFQLWVLSPLWPAYGEAFARNDKQWIMSTLKYSVLVNMAISAACSAILIVFSQFFIRIWAGVALVPSFGLILSMAVLWLIRGWTEPFVSFLNGINRLKGQSIYALGTAFLNVLFQLIAARYFGLVGVVMATIFSYLLIMFWSLPLESYISLKKLSVEK